MSRSADDPWSDPGELARAALLGAGAGMIAAAATSLFQAAWTRAHLPPTQEPSTQPSSTEALADKLAEAAAGDRLSDRDRRMSGEALHYLGYAKPKIVPYDADLRRAADILNAGEKVAILVGAGALGAVDQVIAVADRLQAGAAKALLGKAVLADDLPWVTGTLGLLGSKPSSDMMEHCDTLLMIGTGFPWSEFLPKTGHARAVQIDIDPTMLGIPYPTEVNLHGDAAETLAALLPMLEQKAPGKWREGIAKSMEDWWALMEKRAHAPANPVNPQRVAWELSSRLPADAIITSDSGSCANWFARDIKIRRGMMCSLSGGLASMGAAVPYGVGA